MKLVAFAASNSNQSINKQVVTHAAGLLSGDAGHLSWRARWHWSVRDRDKLGTPFWRGSQGLLIHPQI